MLSRSRSLILAILILVSVASEAAAGSSVLESVTYKTDENRTAITFLYNQPTKMVFYTIGNPPQIVADVVGNAFAQSANVPTEIIVNGVEVKSIVPFIDPSLGDINFYGIDFLVIHLKEKVAYIQVKHKKGYTLYVANSPSLSVSDIKPQFKKEVIKEESQISPEVIPAAQDKTELAMIEGIDVEPITDDNIETQAIAAAINIEPKSSEFEPKDPPKFKPKKTSAKSKKFTDDFDDFDDFMLVDSNLSFGKDADISEDKSPYKKSKKSKVKTSAKKTAQQTELNIVSGNDVKGKGIELTPKNVNKMTPASHAEKIQLAMQWRQVGYSHQKNKDYDKALASYNKAAELYPNYACIHNDIGIIYFYLGVYDKAIEEFHKAIALDSAYLAVYSNLATLYEQIGDNQKAIEYWQRRVDASKSNDVWTQKAKQKVNELKNKNNK